MGAAVGGGEDADGADSAAAAGEPLAAVGDDIASIFLTNRTSYNTSVVLNVGK